MAIAANKLIEGGSLTHVGRVIRIRVGNQDIVDLDIELFGTKPLSKPNADLSLEFIYVLMKIIWKREIVLWLSIVCDMISI